MAILQILNHSSSNKKSHEVCTYSDIQIVVLSKYLKNYLKLFKCYYSIVKSISCQLGLDNCNTGYNALYFSGNNINSRY